jgi:hypothetical protein
VGAIDDDCSGQWIAVAQHVRDPSSQDAIVIGIGARRVFSQSDSRLISVLDVLTRAT